MELWGGHPSRGGRRASAQAGWFAGEMSPPGQLAFSSSPTFCPFLTYFRWRRAAAKGRTHFLRGGRRSAAPRRAFPEPSSRPRRWAGCTAVTRTASPESGCSFTPSFGLVFAAVSAPFAPSSAASASPPVRWESARLPPPLPGRLRAPRVPCEGAWQVAGAAARSPPTARGRGRARGG